MRSVHRKPEPGLQAELHEAMRQARPLRQRTEPVDEPSRVWTETEVVGGEARKALVVILRTRGCTWAIRGGCTMCGYVNDSFIKKIEPDDLVRQFGHALQRFDGHEVIKLYTSGSFLDPTEVPPEAQAGIARLVPAGVVRFQAEAQAHHITRETLAPVRDALASTAEFVLGVGLESTNDATLRYSINKEFTFEDFRVACRAATDSGVGLKAYVMVKPPFLTEADAIEDAVQSARDVHELPGVIGISFNPTTVHKHTLVERLWRAGEYRPPWLWSVAEILRRTAAFAKVPFKSDVVAAGQRRGAHNCGRCDDDLNRAIEAFTITRDTSLLDAVDCACKAHWRRWLQLEPLLWAGGSPHRRGPGPEDE